ncbi:hypothetical protein LEP1GSC137_2302 [Leptospira borgpetersenii str. Noumea 25]|uniref:Uncharacterized protein n=1 Tax=Leptospira borgpetersenii str. 200801926 TaxID=1193009 RepID=A0ABP2S946_LEPBO|nr:hypothetical protein LEP1GSC128_0062 [Leptospira borgpetersenii str. 200801926]EMK08976.1 hypothetical protein LEP1GSC066_1101 [Leptospira sp. serovar Kenya str. Sh9]EMN12454.1 hypothetical protein LEP1GSC055_1097 [Leptospira borgpetersenii str. Brem 307]EMO11791.1 hypothetical protein LEP1GSC137_2302 [Leptospira borgpetersenii str. Noumea 25]ENO62505.1 hypothetical protein LEP1GSC191_3863 [Leptospira borgpetersenii serovar Mini str. 201000851]
MSLREKDMDFFLPIWFLNNSTSGRSKEESYISNIIDL